MQPAGRREEAPWTQGLGNLLLLGTPPCPSLQPKGIDETVGRQPSMRGHQDDQGMDDQSTGWPGHGMTRVWMIRDQDDKVTG